VSRIVLTGFMATGKTEVGRRLARSLGRVFVDTDGLVESEAGCPVAEVFAREGEPAFRARERRAVERACAVPDAVIATGGGTLGDPDNRRRLLAAGPLVCLTATPEEILRRVGDAGGRPLLASANGDRLGRIRALLAERAPLYALAAHTVDTTGLEPEQVAERVRALVTGR
jgi:shikimate kinase